MNYANSMLELIGNTPLLKLNKVAAGVPANVFVKLENMNPSGSYKDRMALAMINAAERGLTWNHRKLFPGGTVCDASAGNCAPAIAFVCAAKGLKAKLSIYKPMLKGGGTRLKITGAYGPEVCESRPPSDFLTGEQEKNVSGGKPRPDLDHGRKEISQRTRKKFAGCRVAGSDLQQIQLHRTNGDRPRNFCSA